MGRGKDIPQYFYHGEEAAKRFINPEEPVFDGPSCLSASRVGSSLKPYVFRRGLGLQVWQAHVVLTPDLPGRLLSASPGRASLSGSRASLPAAGAFHMRVCSGSVAAAGAASANSVGCELLWRAAAG